MSLETQGLGIPLHYYSLVVGHAQVDHTSQTRLLSRQWNVEIPRAIREHSKRPDIILGMLQEDPTLLPRCHPYCWVGRFPLRLSRAILRPEICDLLPLLQRGDRETPQRIRELTKEVHIVVFVDNDRTNCRSENLREISKREVETSQGV